MTTIPNTIVRTGAPSYGRCPRELLRDPSISMNAKAMYVVLDDYADKGGRSFPSRKTLADMLGVDPSTVDRVVKELVTSGWCQKEARYREGGAQTSTLYTLTWGRRARTGGVGVSEEPPSASAPNQEEEPVEPESTKEEPSLTADASSPTDLDLTFAEFWDVYPRKVGKRAALKTWPAAVARVIKESKVHVDLTVSGAGTWIVVKAREMANDRNLPTKDLIPHPSTWLNRDGWNDEPYPPKTGNAPIRTAGESYTGEGRVMTADEWDQPERTAARG